MGSGWQFWVVVYLAVGLVTALSMLIDVHRDPERTTRLMEEGMREAPPDVVAALGGANSAARFMFGCVVFATFLVWPLGLCLRLRHRLRRRKGDR